MNETRTRLGSVAHSYLLILRVYWEMGITGQIFLAYVCLLYLLTFWSFLTYVGWV